MTILSEEMRNRLADEYGNRAAFVSLHDGNPGTTGANEVSGGGYTREIPSWSSASGSQVQATMTFDLPATTITHVGVWNSGETTLLDSYELSSSVIVSSAGQRNVTTTYTQGS